jgi:mannose-6-phosphate isomerase-like protein (cupin superfamily)
VAEAVQVTRQRDFEVFEIRPQLLESGKTSSTLLRGQTISCGVQVIAEGGENNLHTHPNNEAIWLVMQGEAGFYTTDDKLVAKVGRYQAIYVPNGAPYWFENSNPEENLVILRLGARVADAPDQRGRVDLSERKFAMTNESTEGTELEKRELKPLAGVFFGA